MNARRSRTSRTALAAVGAVAFLLLPGTALAHCDTLDGPVVTDAKQALDKGDVTPVLKWVTKENEDEIRKAFQRTLAVRAKGPEAKELADLWFFETLVRVHRAGEGAPFTGLKPAGEVEPIVAAADKAMDGGSVEDLAKHVAEAVVAGIRKRFAETVKAKEHAGHTVEMGRRFVAAYVEFVHYVERLHQDAAASAAHHEHAAQPAAEHGHEAKEKAEPKHHHE